MKKFILIITVQLLFLNIFSQKAVAPHDKIEKFYNTTTCVVYDSDIFNTYNSAIEKAVKQSWTITPYKFISMEDFNKMKSNPDYSFLVRTKVYPVKNNTNAEYTFLTLVMGQADTRFEDLTEICSFPLSYYNVDYDKYDYKIGALLLFVQNHIDITYNNPDLDEKNIIRYYNKNISKINQKTLYLNTENLENKVDTEQEISKYYSGIVKLTNAQTIQQAINQKREDVVILHLVSPSQGTSYEGKCYKMLVGAADGKLYYFDNHNINWRKPGKFLKNDFKKLE